MFKLEAQEGYLEEPQAEQEATNTDKRIAKCQENISETEKCVCLNTRIIVNQKKKNELNLMVEDIDPHIIGIIDSWANIDIADAELGLTVYVTFRRDLTGRRGGGVISYILLNVVMYNKTKLSRDGTERHPTEGSSANILGSV